MGGERKAAKPECHIVYVVGTPKSSTAFIDLIEKYNYESKTTTTSLHLSP